MPNKSGPFAAWAQRRAVVIGLASGWFFASLAPAEVMTLDALQKAAKAGNYGAQRELGKAYYLGTEGPAQDYGLAYQWLLKAAVQEDPTAEAYLGRLYEEGHGVDKDVTKALDWYLRAAKQGDLDSECRVGKIFMEGHVIKADPAKGFACLLHAASENDGPGQLAVANCYAHGWYVRVDPVLAYKWALLASVSLPEAQAQLPDFRKNLSREQIDRGQLDAEDWVRRGKFGIPQDALGITFDDNGARTKMDFVYANGDICIPVMVQNRARVYMIVDTGMSQTVIDTEVAPELGLNANDYNALGAFGDNIAMGADVGGVRIKLKGMTLSNARVTLSPLSTAVSAFSEPHPFGDETPLGGILGSDILSRFVIHLDYADKTIEFILPEDFQYDRSAMAMPLAFHGQIPVVSATIGTGVRQSAPGGYAVDTGNAGALSLTRLFANANPKLGLRTSLYSGVFGLAGPSPAQVGKCYNLEIGDATIPKPVFFFAQPREDAWSCGTIGDDVWRRFEVTIDYPGGKLYLKKYSEAALDQPFTCNLYGLLIKQIRDVPMTFVVSKVWGGSAAYTAGIVQGDEVKAVNGADITTFTTSRLQALLNREGVIKLAIPRNNIVRSVTLKSASLPDPGPVVAQ